MKKNAVVVLAMLTLFVAVSCTSIAPAVSSQYVGNEQNHWYGDYTAVLNCTLYEADKAVCAMSRRARFVENSRFNCQTIMNYEYKDLYDGKVSIRLQEINETQVKVVIKVGKSGDVESSQEILMAIDEELHAMSGN